MSPSAALARCLGARYRSFAGRSCRSEFWWFSSVAWLILAWVLSTFPFRSLSATVPIMAVLALVPPCLAVTARRLHDTGLSGWWQAPVLALLGLAGFLAAGQGGVRVLGIVVLVLLLAPSCWLLARPGTDGPNRFGPDPLTDPLEAQA